MQVLDDGAFRFVKADGRAFEISAPEPSSSPADWTQLPVQHRERNIRIDKTTADTRWRGERMDYGMAMDALFAQSKYSAEGQLLAMRIDRL